MHFPIPCFVGRIQLKKYTRTANSFNLINQKLLGKL